MHGSEWWRVTSVAGKQGKGREWKDASQIERTNARTTTTGFNLAASLLSYIDKPITR